MNRIRKDLLYGIYYGLETILSTLYIVTHLTLIIFILGYYYS